MRCLFCNIRDKKNSVKCQFCDYFLESSPEMKKTLSYLENGFAKIYAELDDIERKVDEVVGIVFRRHRYSAEDLLDSSQMNRIQALAGKIKDDVTRWEAAGKLPYRMKVFYNENAESAQYRLRRASRLIQDRKPTLWERVGAFFIKLYRIIAEFLPVMFQRLLSGQRQKFLGSTA